MCQGSKPLRHWSEQWPRVRKIVRSDETDFSCERERARQPMPRVWPWQNQLEQFLSTNAGKPSRERPTLIRIFEVEGYSATGPRNTPTARARLWGWLRCCAPVCEDPVTEPGRCDGPSPCAIVVCPRRGLAVRPEPRRRFGQRRHGHREGGPRPALPQPMMPSRPCREHFSVRAQGEWGGPACARARSLAIGLEPMALRWLDL